MVPSGTVPSSTAPSGTSPSAPDRSLLDRYRDATADRPDHPAVIDRAGAPCTAAELVARAERAAAGFQELGLDAGDHVGVFLPNRAEWVVAALAASATGIGLLGLNTRFREAELNHLLGVAEVDTVVVVDRFLGIDGPSLFRTLDRPTRLVVVGDDAAPARSEVIAWSTLTGSRTAASGTAGSGTAAAAGRTATEGSRPPGPDDPLIGFTTSGTTGFPKVAMHTGRQTAAHLDAVIDSFGLGPETVTLVPLPLCGAFGYSLSFSTLLAGGTVVLQETWDPKAAAEALERHGVTWFSASDDMLLAVLDLAGSGRGDPDRAGPAPATTWRTGGFADFTNAGARAAAEADRISGGRTSLSGLYGSSEGFALMSTWAFDAPLDERSRNGGHLVGPTMEVRACDPDTGRVLDHGEPGELHFRGPNLIDRYLNNPEATARAFTDDGWYRSGDLGQTVDPDERGHQGFVYLARLGDSLRLRGFLCDPAEIERHLEDHPGVELAQVVGVDRPGAGQVAVAFVRLAPDVGPGPDEATLDAHCRQGLANYKRPERIVAVDEFPVTDGPNGVKIRKVELRERAARLLGV